jgi:integrase
VNPISHVEDRWFCTVTGPDGKPAKEKRTRHGTGRRWRVRYEDVDRRERSRSFDRRADADAFKTEVDAALRHGTYHDPDAGRISLRKYAEEWLKAQTFDAVTREAVESRLRLHIFPGLGGKRLDELAARPSLIKAWMAGLDLAPSTVAKVFTHLNTIMLAAALDGRVRVNPCAGLSRHLPQKTDRHLRPWTPEQAARVRGALPPRLAAIVDAGKGLGLRQSEIFGLAVGEIDFLRRQVHVRQQVKLVAGRPVFAPPKGLKERHVPLAAPTANALAAHLAAFPAVPVTLPWHEPKNRQRHGRPHAAALLFVTTTGRPLHRNSFNANTWHPAVLAAGLPDDRVNGCHMLRHLYASTLISRAIDVRTVAEYLGHSDGGALVLKTYSHLMPDAEDKTRRALETALADDGVSPSAVPQTASEGDEGP